MELNGLDPFFNYRATNFLVNNGIEEYFQWHDEDSWHPVGRNISETSQVGLHITAAYLYMIFGMGLTLYEFTILFPVVIASLTCIVIFAMVRKIAGVTPGLFASLFFAVSPLIIARSSIGWFKSEPLGLFYGLLSLYLLFSALQAKDHRVSFLKLIGGGLFLGFGISSWGGVMFFVIPLSLFIIAIPFLRKDHSFLIWAMPLFVASTIAIGFLVRPGLNFSIGLGGFALIGPAVFLVILILVQKISSNRSKRRNSFIFLAAFLIIIFALVFSDVIPFPESSRYIRVINPFYEIEDPIFSTVSEHQAFSITKILFAVSILIPFAVIGVWYIFKQKIEKTGKHFIKNEMMFFVLCFGIVGIYVGFALSRLLIFSALSVIILSSIGVAFLISYLLKRKNFEQSSFYLALLVIVLILPTFFPSDTNWVNVSNQPPAILTGLSHLETPSDDWLHALSWIKNNTSTDAVVVAWWDYGYWITALGERKTIADGATFPEPPHIKKTAELFLSNPEKSYEILKEFDADYVMISWTGKKLEQSNSEEYYQFITGGDMSKMNAIISIAEKDPKEFLQNNKALNSNFWENTLLGKMIPFKPAAQVKIQDATKGNDSVYLILFEKRIDYGSQNDQPLKLVYASPSFDRKDPGSVLAVLVYEVNDNYE